MLVDMPLSELVHYQGRTPKPADFDEYWARGLSQVEALGTDCELIPADFHAPGAECFDLYFTGVLGARVHAKFARPVKRSSPTPAMLMFHGYTGNAGSWSDKLAYVCAGYSVAAMDCRGQGGYSEDVGGVKGTTFRGQIIRGLDDPNPDMLTMRAIFLDTAQLARIVMAMDGVDKTRVGATGGSQGGGLTLACAALTPGLNRVAPKVPFLCDYQRVWEMDLATQAYEEIKIYFRNFDPQHLREKEIFTKLGYIDNIHLADRIRSEVLMITCMVDTVCPPSTQFAAYNKITTKKDVLIYPDFSHEVPHQGEDLAFEFLTSM